MLIGLLRKSTLLTEHAHDHVPWAPVGWCPVRTWKSSNIPTRKYQLSSYVSWGVKGKLACDAEFAMCHMPHIRVRKKVPLMRYPSRAYILGCQRPQCAILNAKPVRRTNRQNFFPVKDDLTVMHSAPSPISISCLRYLFRAKLAVMRNMEKVATFKWPINMWMQMQKKGNATKLRVMWTSFAQQGKGWQCPRLNVHQKQPVSFSAEKS